MADEQTVDIGELYTRDPEQISDKEFETLILDMRERHKNFIKAEGTPAQKAKKAGTASRAKKKDAPPELDLDDLGL